MTDWCEICCTWTRHSSYLMCCRGCIYNHATFIILMVSNVGINGDFVVKISMNSAVIYFCNMLFLLIKEPLLFGTACMSKSYHTSRIMI